METILHTPHNRSEEQQNFDSAIEELRETIEKFWRAIEKLQGNTVPNPDDPLLNQLDDIKFIFNDLINNLMDEKKRLALKNERLALWKQSLARTIEFIVTRLPDQSLREALERLYEKTCQSIHDPLPDPYQITIGL